MDLMEAIQRRRAVRSFSPDVVDEATVRKLLDAAVQAPSAMNAQPWGFAVVQDKARLARYSDRARALLLEHARTEPKAARYVERLSRPDFNIFYDAGTLIVIGAPAAGAYTQADCWLAAENLQLAAVALGLGTCCIGFAVPVLNQPDVKAELGLGPELAAVAPLIVGRPTAWPPAVPRAAPRILSWLR